MSTAMPSYHESDFRHEDLSSFSDDNRYTSHDPRLDPVIVLDIVLGGDTDDHILVMSDGARYYSSIYAMVDEVGNQVAPYLARSHNVITQPAHPNDIAEIPQQVMKVMGWDKIYGEIE